MREMPTSAILEQALNTTMPGRISLSIKQIRALVRNGLYYLTEHADDEAAAEDLDIYDVEHGLLAGRIRKTWPHEGKYEVVGPALDGRQIGVVCRITQGGKVRVITVYEDKPKLGGRERV